MDIRKLHEPYDARPLESGAVQKLYKFANGYGASVVKGEHTYGGDEGLWELAVLKFKTDGDFVLDYSTPITEDVEGHLTDDAVEELLDRIEALPRGALINGHNDRVHKDINGIDNTEVHKMDNTVHGGKNEL